MTTDAEARESKARQLFDAAVSVGSVALPWVFQLELCVIDPGHQALIDIEAWAVWERNGEEGKKAITEVAVASLADRGLILPGAADAAGEYAVAPELGMILAARRQPIFTVTFTSESGDALTDVPRMYGIEDEATGVALVLFELVSGPVVGPPGRQVSYSLCDLAHATKLIVAWLQRMPGARRGGDKPGVLILSGTEARHADVLTLDVGRRHRTVTVVRASSEHLIFEGVDKDADDLSETIGRVLADRT